MALRRLKVSSKQHARGRGQRRGEEDDEEGGDDAIARVVLQLRLEHNFSTSRHKFTAFLFMFVLEDERRSI